MGRPSLLPGHWGKPSPRKLPDGSTQVTVRYRRLDGSTGRVTVERSTFVAAERVLKERLPILVAEPGPASPEPDTARTFNTVALEWIEFDRVRMEQGEISLGTFTEHKRLAISVLIPRLDGMLLTDITASVIADHYMAMVKLWAPQARNAKAVLSLIMTYATMRGYVDRNLVAEVPAFKRKKKPVFAPAVPELAEFREAIVAYNEDPDRPGPTPGPLLLDVIDVMLATGVRIGEVLGLRWVEDVFLNADEPYIMINGSIKEKGGPKKWEGHPKTESGFRIIRIPDYVVAIFLRRMVGNGTSDFVFHTRTGRPNGPQDVHRALRNVRHAMGMPEEWIPHALRKSIGTEVAETMGVESAAGLLGHERSRVTEQFYWKKHGLAPDNRAMAQARFELIVANSKPDPGAS